MPPAVAQDRLVRREVALGRIRDILPPQSHIGLTQIAPWLEVQSDEVIFDYVKGLADGLSPARAEDAEAELAQKDTMWAGQGRASIIDWSLKDHYTASDVSRYREMEAALAALQATNSIGTSFTGRMVEDFQGKLDRDTDLRRRKLDNRMEWLIMQAIENAIIAYNDGKIKFTVDFQRPAGQHNQAPKAGDLASPTAPGLFSATTSDPIATVDWVQRFMFETYGIRITRAITSRRVLNSIINSDRFAARTGLVTTSGGTTVDPKYLIDGWGPAAAIDVVQRATGLTFIEYDSVYRTRPIGSTTTTNNKFLSDNKIYFLPDEADLAEFAETEIGFAKMLTAPHVAGDWSPGFYEWEYEYGVDPWGYDVGSGVKAFPVFPHMDLTYTCVVL